MIRLWLVLIGLLGGLLGGMGMGGGTLLIPLLTMLLDYPQKAAQLINLLSFVIMSIYALVLHFKNKLIMVKSGLIMASGGILTAIIFSFLMQNVNNQVLKKCFGGFLVALALLQLVLFIIQKKSTNKNESNKKNDAQAS